MTTRISGHNDQLTYNPISGYKFESNPLSYEPSSNQRLIRTPNGRVANQSTSPVFAQFINERRYDKDKYPRFIEVLHELLNRQNTNYDWEGDYKRGASQLMLNGVQPFPEGSAEPKLELFKQRLRQIFLQRQNFDLPAPALQQLVQLSTISGVSSFSANLQTYLLDKGYIKFVNAETNYVNIEPSKTHGVIDIIFTVGFYDIEPGITARNPGSNNIRSMNQQKEPVLRLIVAVKGFYDDKANIFKFPIHWANLGFDNEHITCSMNTNWNKYRDLIEHIDLCLWCTHNVDEPKWHLAMQLHDFYLKQKQHQQYSHNPRSKVWQYFAMGCGKQISARSPQHETIRAQYAAEILSHGEKLNDFARKMVMLQMKLAHASEELDDFAVDENPPKEKTVEIIIAAQKKIKSWTQLLDPENEIDRNKQKEIHKQIEEIENNKSRLLLQDLIARETVDCDIELIHGLSSLIYFQNNNLELAFELRNTISNYYVELFKKSKTRYDRDNEYYEFNVIQHGTDFLDQLSPTLSRTLKIYTEIGRFLSSNYYAKGIVLSKKRGYFSTSDGSKLNNVLQNVFDNAHDQKKIKTLLSQARKMTLMNNELSKAWTQCCDHILGNSQVSSNNMVRCSAPSTKLTPSEQREMSANLGWFNRWRSNQQPITKPGEYQGW